MFDDDVDNKIIERQKELQKIVPSTTYSNIVNSMLKDYLQNAPPK
jgi:hypothetical protein